MKVASRNIILPLSTKSFQKSFQGFALLPSIFLKRNIFSIIPSRLYVTTFELIRLNLSFPFPHFLYFSVYLYNGETLLTPYVCIYIYTIPYRFEIHLSHLVAPPVNLCRERNVIPLSKYSRRDTPPSLNWLCLTVVARPLNKFLHDRELDDAQVT